MHLRRTARSVHRLAIGAVLGLLLGSLLTGGAPGGAARSPSGGGLSPHPLVTSLPTYTVQSFNASSDGWPLSYEEWLPAGYTAENAYPLIVYLDGLSCNNQTWVTGGRPSQLLDHLSGSSPISNASRGLVTNSSAQGYILIAPNTRTCAGFSVNSPCGGPQGQDLQDAINREEAMRSIQTDRVYLVATSAGADGAVAYVVQHPHVIAGLAISDAALDLFEEFQFLLMLANHHNTGAEDNINAIVGLDCGVYPSPSNTSAVDLFEELSEARLDPQGLNGTPVWVAAGGGDTTTPDNLHSWPYLQVNNTFVNSTCLVATGLGEPPNCTTTMASLNQRDPANFSFRFVYEPSAGHGLGQMLPADFLAFFGGEVPGGYYLAQGYPMGPVTPQTGFSYRPPPPPTYPVQVTEVGLPPGTPWEVTLDGQSLRSSSPEIQFAKPDGSYSYQVTPEPGFASVAPGTVLVNGTAVQLPVTFVPFTVYPLWFNETGLPQGSSWGVSLNGTLSSTNTSSVLLEVPNGTYTYTVAPAGGGDPTPTGGDVVVAGGPVAVNVSFVLPAFYPVYFNESGLPNGSSWQVDLPGGNDSVSGPSISVDLENGTYPFEIPSVDPYLATPSEGELSVVGGLLWVNITFQWVATFPVTFCEVGLPNGTLWGVAIAGDPTVSDGGDIEWQLANGSYSYSVVPVTGYTSISAGEVAVSGAGVTVNISFALALFPVEFDETGLRNGTLWSVTFDGTTNSSMGPSIDFTSADGSFAYSVAAVPGYVPPGNGTVIVADGAVLVTLSFQWIPVYVVTFSETGLPVGTAWSVGFAGTNWTTGSPTLQLTVPNGTYPYSVGAGSEYTATPSHGAVTVDGQAVGVPVAFSLVSYPVTFTESGLPTHSSWSVTVLAITYNVTSRSTVIDLPNGTFPYSIGAVAGFTVSSPGSVTVAGAAAGVSVTFQKVVDYSVKFGEAGLKAGLVWSVTLGGRALNASSPAVVSFSVPNGAYSFAVGAIAGYQAAPSSGSITVAGAGQTIHIAFTAVVYVATFSESGLPSGSHWKVTVGTTSNTSGTSTITFRLSNGSYSYSFGAVAGYATPPGGLLRVNGSPVRVNVTYSLILTYSVKFTETGLAKSTVWTLIVNNKRTNLTGPSGTTNLANGTYPYSVSATGYSAAPSSGSVTVNGTSVTVAITFTKSAGFAGGPPGPIVGPGVPAWTARPRP